MEMWKSWSQILSLFVASLAQNGTRVKDFKPVNQKCLTLAKFQFPAAANSGAILKRLATLLVRQPGEAQPLANEERKSRDHHVLPVLSKL